MISRDLQPLQFWGCIGCESTSDTETRGHNPPGEISHLLLYVLNYALLTWRLLSNKALCYLGLGN